MRVPRGSAAGRTPVGGRRRAGRIVPGPGPTSPVGRPGLQVGQVGNRHPAAVGVDRLGDHQPGGHQGRPVDPVHRTRTGRGGEVEPGVAGEGQLGGGTREPPTHPLGVGVLHRHPQLGGGLGVDRGVGLVRADQPGVELGELLEGPRPAQGALEGAQRDGGLLLDVQSREHEGHGVPPPAQQVEADLDVGRRRLPGGPRDRAPGRDPPGSPRWCRSGPRRRCWGTRAGRSRTAAGR